MRPLFENIFIKELQNNGNVTPEGVILPDTIKLQYEIGLVAMVGEGRVLPDGTRKPPDVAVGNIVAYHANSGVKIHVEGQACRFVLESNIIAVLTENGLEEEEEVRH